MDINRIIKLLKFVKEHVFTAQNVERAHELGEDLGQIIGEIVEFVSQMDLLEADDGMRSIGIKRAIREAGVEDVVKSLRGQKD
jgi:hypothetical protein